MSERELILDTHVWIWAEEGTSVLGKRAADALDKAAVQGALRVSVISVWEVAMLVAKKRLHLSLSIDDWVHRGLSQRGIQMNTLTAAVAIESSRLPGLPALDPADRILIATARTTGATLVTADKEILTYARAGHLSAMNAAE